MPRALISTDRRADGSLESNAHRAFPLLDAFQAADWESGLLNINRALPDVERAARGAVVMVLADTFAPDSPGAGQWSERHEFRSWLQTRAIQFVGSEYAGVRRSSSCDKVTARQVLVEAGIPVPRGVAMRRGHAVEGMQLAAGLSGPMVVKKATATGGGVGVHLASGPGEAVELVRWYHEFRNCDMVVEEFVAGREFSGWVIDRDGTPRCYGLVEIRKPYDAPILDQGAKVRAISVEAFSDEPRVPETLVAPPLSPPARNQLAATVLAAHRACGLRHYSRVDLIQHGDELFVLDVNAAPEIAEAGLGSVAEANGETLAEVVVGLARDMLK